MFGPQQQMQGPNAGQPAGLSGQGSNVGQLGILSGMPGMGGPQQQGEKNISDIGMGRPQLQGPNNMPGMGNNTPFQGKPAVMPQQQGQGGISNMTMPRMPSPFGVFGGFGGNQMPFFNPRMMMMRRGF